MLLRFVNLQTPCVEQTVDFYAALGLPVLARGPGYGVLRAGTTQLMWQQAPSDRRPTYHFAFDIPRNQLTEAAAWLSRRVALLEQDGATRFDFPDWNASAVYFYDPAGNIVEFIARSNLANDHQGEFGPEQILRVSELGWPVADPEQAQQLFGLPAWRDYGPFKALGGETGLILLVSEGRPWKPTVIPALIAPATVVCELDGEIRQWSR